MVRKTKTIDNIKERLETAKLINEGAILKQKDIEELTEKDTGIDADLIKKIFDASWDVIFREIEQGNTVKLHGKGVFYLSERSARMGRNPVSGEKHLVEAREVMAFQVSKAYAKSLKKYRDQVNIHHEK